MGIRIGLVGLGSFGRSFAELFKHHPLVDRVALCDREPDRVAAYAEKASWRDKFNPSDAYGSLDEILKADLDALVIITQPWLHAPQCIAAMESGKSVYSAVPIISIPDGNEILDWCDRLVATVNRTGRHYMLGETTYFRPEAMYCRRRAAEGAFGEFVYAEGEYFHAFDLPSCDLRQVQASRTASRSGREWPPIARRYIERGVRNGPMHYPTHSTGGPISVMNAHATKVCCWGHGPVSDDAYFEDMSSSNETGFFLMSNGATMRISEYREIGFLGRETFRIYGTQGSFEHSTWVTKTQKTPLTVEQMRDPLPPEVLAAFQKIEGMKDVYGGHGGSHAFLVHEFVDAIAADRVPAINIWEAARYMAAGVMAHQSALKGGETLDVPDWGDAPGGKQGRL